MIDALERMVEGKPLPWDEIAALIRVLRFDQVILEVRGRKLSEAQRTLEEFKKRCAELYEQAPVAYVTLDETGRICGLNSAAALIGTAGAQALRQPFPGTSGFGRGRPVLSKSALMPTAARAARKRVHAPHR
ncbi:MAG: hypothetical protein H7X91_05735 [Burkholderiales bacterium]|nr:hypothetical protein [Burkholderiales bacterium]